MDKTSFDALTQGLNHTNPKHRRDACRSLAQSSDEQVVGYLIERLQDIDSEVRQAACQALGHLQSQRAVEPLICRLEDGHWLVRRATCVALGQLGSKDAVLPLINQLTDVNANVRRVACQALGELGDTQAVMNLIQRLVDKDIKTRYYACIALGKLGDKRAVTTLISLLKKYTNLTVRKASCIALGQLGDKQAVYPLISMLKDVNFDVRRVACKALSQLGDQRAVNPLIDCLDGKHSLRMDACVALGQLGDERAVEPLIEWLGDVEPDVRQAACQALERLGEGQLAWAVLNALAGKNEGYQQLGRFASEGDRRAMKPLFRLLVAPNSYLRRASCIALGQLGDEQAAEPLISMLKDEDFDVRRVACKALGQIGCKRALPYIFQLLENDNSYPRQIAVESLVAIVSANETHTQSFMDTDNLGRRITTIGTFTHLEDDKQLTIFLQELGDSGIHHDAYLAFMGIIPKIIEILIQQLGDFDSRIRQAACEALEQLGEGQLARAVLDALAGEKNGYLQLARFANEGDRRATKPLVRLLVAPNSYLRRTSCIALGQLGDEQAVAPLISKLKDEDLDIRRVACKALGQLGDERAVEPLIERLGDAEPDVRQAACEALERLGEGRLARAFRDVMFMKEEAQQELVRIASEGDFRMVSPLIQRLGDHDQHVRSIICKVLGQLGDMRVVDPLILKLDDKDFNVRCAACKALGILGDERAVSSLVQRLGDHNLVQRSACEALGYLRDERAIPHLVQQLADNDSEIRKSARTALVNIGSSSINPLIQQLGSKKTHVRAAAGEALNQLGEGNTVLAIQGAIAGDKSAYNKLEKFPTEEALRAIDPLIIWLENCDTEERKTACRGLAAIGKALKPGMSQLLCRKCLSRYVLRRFSYGRGISAKIPVCRLCGDTSETLFGVREVVAVLDAIMENGIIVLGDRVRANWLKLEMLFDFDLVEISGITDHEIERFAILVGNDTDSFRKPRYQNMSCVVKPECVLSENTLRILKNTFGEVVVESENARQLSGGVS